MLCCTSQAALTSFDDTNSKELEIEVVTQEVTRLFREAEKQLQRFGHQQSATAADDKVGLLCSVLCPTGRTPIAYLADSSMCRC